MKKGRGRGSDGLWEDKGERSQCVRDKKGEREGKRRTLGRYGRKRSVCKR